MNAIKRLAAVIVMAIALALPAHATHSGLTAEQMKLREQWCQITASKFKSERITNYMVMTNPKIAKRVARFERKCHHLLQH